MIDGKDNSWVRVWTQSLTLGEYDIWIDVNQNGLFDGQDVWNSQVAGIYAAGVIPEFPSFLILPLFMLTTLLAVIVHRRNRTKFNNIARAIFKDI